MRNFKNWNSSNLSNFFSFFSFSNKMIQAIWTSQVFNTFYAHMFSQNPCLILYAAVFSIFSVNYAILVAFQLLLINWALWQIICKNFPLFHSWGADFLRFSLFRITTASIFCKAYVALSFIFTKYLWVWAHVVKSFFCTLRNKPRLPACLLALRTPQIWVWAVFGTFPRIQPLSFSQSSSNENFSTIL